MGNDFDTSLHTKRLGHTSSVPRHITEEELMPNQSLVEDPSVYENAGDLRHDGLPLRYQYPRIHLAWLRRRRSHRHSTLFCHPRIRLQQVSVIQNAVFAIMVVSELISATVRKRIT